MRAALDALLRGGLLGLAAGAIVALRIAERGEAYSPRALAVIALFAAGAFLAGVTGALALRWLSPRAFTVRTALGGIGGLGLQLAFVFGLFALGRNSDLLIGTLQEVGVRDFILHGLLGLTIDAGGAFAVTARPYLLPWPSLATAVCAAAILAPRRAEPLRGRVARVT